MKQRRVYEFDEFIFDADNNVLLRHGQQIPLQKRTGEFLGLLLEKATSDFVSKEKIFSSLYGRIEVYSDQSLYFQIHQLRSALGDRVKNPKYVHVQKKRGIRFIAEVRLLDREIEAGALQSEIASIPIEAASKRQRIIETIAQSPWRGGVASLVLLLIIIVVLASFIGKNRSASKMTPKLYSIVPLSTLVAGQEVYVQLTGEGFESQTARVLVIGRGCLESNPCCVPNEPIHWYGKVTETKMEKVPLRLAPGEFRIAVQNGPEGQVSNQVSLNVEVP